MLHFDTFSILSGSESSFEPESTSAFKLVVASFNNGSMLPEERAAVLEAAQKAGVTTWKYLRGRLLLQANISLEDLLDNAE